MNKQVHIIGGGTMFHIRPHLALCAPAYGTTAYDIANEVTGHLEYEGEVHVYTTRMAGDEYQAHAVSLKGKITHLPEKEDDLRLETNEDVARLLDKLIEDPAPKIIFMPVALCDFEVESVHFQGRGTPEEETRKVGKQHPRLKSVDSPILALKPADKVINRVRKTRKDIFLVGFKTTTGASPDEMFNRGLKLLKEASCNLVLANDLHTKVNMVITPEQAAYEVTTDRGVAIATLVDMALSRAQGRFTRTEVAPGQPVDWNSPEVPETLRAVVNYCINRGAYKPFLGATVGHFAFKVAEDKFVTSRRKTNFNQLDKVGMVAVQAVDDEKVIAYGGKPSVGGQSQRIIFKNHPDVDCIVHFHCPLKPGAILSTKLQYPHECGSHECGQNTSDGLTKLHLRHGNKSGIIKAVMLDKHGPNIVFHRDADPQAIINFIEDNFDLEKSTSGVYV